LQAGNAQQPLSQVVVSQAGAGGADPMYALLAVPGGASSSTISSQASMGTSSGKTLAVVAVAGVVGVGLYFIFRKPSRGESR
jgi:hypothetical protein